MILFLTYLLMGLTLSLPIGAISIEMVKQGMKNGFLHGWLIGLGAMMVDVSLILLLYFGFSSFLSAPFLQSFMWLLGAVLLFYIALDNIKNADKDINLGNEEIKKSKKSSFMRGFLVGISPANIVFWLGVFGTVLSNSLIASPGSEFFIISLGFLSGIILHDVGFMSIVSVTRKFLNERHVKRISILAGCALLFLSMYFVFEFITSIPQNLAKL